MIYTQEYERWFRDVGQFLEPAGDLQNAGKLDLLKQWGAAVWSDRVSEIKDLQDTHNGEIKELEKSAEDMDDLKAEIRQKIAIDEGDSPSAVIEDIGKLVGA